MATLESRLEAPVTVAFSTLVPGDVFRNGANFYIKIVPDAAGVNALNLTNFTVETLTGTLAVTPIDAFIDEVEV